MESRKAYQLYRDSINTRRNKIKWPSEENEQIGTLRFYVTGTGDTVI